jgi:hypothetical protein
MKTLCLTHWQKDSMKPQVVVGGGVVAAAKDGLWRQTRERERERYKERGDFVKNQRIVYWESHYLLPFDSSSSTWKLEGEEKAMHA